MRDAIAILAIIVVSAVTVFTVSTLKAYAAPAVKVSEPGCEPFSTVGIVIIMRCIDDDNNVFFANSAGYMMPAGN